MSAMKMGASFLAGTFFGAFMARGFQRRCHHLRELREAGGRDRRPCPLPANEKKTGDSNPGGQAGQLVAEEKMLEERSNIAEA